MKKRYLLLLLVLLLSQLILPVSADTLTRPPYLDIEVVNAPTQPYYLDLLIDDGETLLFRELYIKDHDPEMIATLESLVPEGMHSALWGGTNQRLRGSLTGSPLSNGKMLHSFDGYGTPKRFKILIVLEDGTTKVSDWYETEMYIGKIFFDYDTLSFKRRPITLFYVTNYLLLVIPYVCIKVLINKLGKVITKKLDYVVLSLACIIELLVIAPFMSYGTIYNGSLGQAAMVLMFAEMIYTFLEYLYLNMIKRVPTLKAASISFGANIIASLVLIQVLPLEFKIFLM